MPITSDRPRECLPYQQFFPLIEPFGGSRLRAHTTADVLGNTFTNYYDKHTMNESVYYWMTANDWVATSRLSADTDQNFTSWERDFQPSHVQWRLLYHHSMASNHSTPFSTC